MINKSKPATLMTKDKANETAAMLNANEHAESLGWTYAAVHDPKGTGFSFIAVHDEDGEFVGKI